nr:hypothetical protein Iba_chr14eCG2450 [Ipomoea batatas]
MKNDGKRKPPRQNHVGFTPLYKALRLVISSHQPKKLTSNQVATFPCLPHCTILFSHLLQTFQWPLLRLNHLRQQS